LPVAFALPLLLLCLSTGTGNRQRQQAQGHKGMSYGFTEMLHNVFYIKKFIK